MPWRILSVLLGLLVLGVTLVCQSHNALAGFPDGHRTAYDLAVVRPFGWLCDASLIFGVLLLGLGLLAKGRKIPTLLGLGILAYALGIVLPAFLLRYYYLYYLQLDNGFGG